MPKMLTIARNVLISVIFKSFYLLSNFHSTIPMFLFLPTIITNILKQLMRQTDKSFKEFGHSW